MTKDTGTTVFVTNEYGIAFALLTVLVAVVMIRRLRHNPKLQADYGADIGAACDLATIPASVPQSSVR